MGKKITFVHLCGPDFHSKSVPPLGLCSIAGYLIHKVGIPEEQIGFVEDLLFKAEKAVRVIISEEPEFVGMSTLSAEQTVPNIYMMMRIKEELPNTVIIAGGAHASGIAESYLKRSPWLDIVVIGEGELPLAQILHAGAAPSAERKWAQIPNLMFRRRSGAKYSAFFLTEQRLLEFNLSDIRSYYPKHNLKFHTTFTLSDMFEFSGMGVNIPVETSRGCPYSCNFCMVPWIFKGNYRLRPVKAIIRDLIALNDTYGEDSMGESARFLFWDANFGMNPSWRAEWVQTLEKLDKRFEWECESRVDSVNAEVMKRFSELGLIQTLVGIESGSQRVRKEIYNKNLRLERLLDTLEKTKDVVHYVLTFIFGAPSETLEEMNETVLLGRKISKILGLTYPNHEYIVWPFKIYPKTYLTEHLSEFLVRGTKLLVEEEWWMDPNSLNWYNCHIEPLPGVTKEKIGEMIWNFYDGIHGSEYNRLRIEYEKLLIDVFQKAYNKYSALIMKSISTS